MVEFAMAPTPRKMAFAALQAIANPLVCLAMSSTTSLSQTLNKLLPLGSIAPPLNSTNFQVKTQKPRFTTETKPAENSCYLSLCSELS